MLFPEIVVVYSGRQYLHVHQLCAWGGLLMFRFDVSLLFLALSFPSALERTRRGGSPQGAG